MFVTFTPLRSVHYNISSEKDFFETFWANSLGGFGDSQTSFHLDLSSFFT